MKNEMYLALTLSLALAAGIGAPGSAAAEPGHRPGFANSSSACCGPHAGERQGKFLEKWAVLLKLTDTQQAQISEMLQAELQATAPLRQQAAALGKQVRSALAPPTFDETAARNLLAQLAATRTELAISHAKLRSRMFALLTPEQQATAQQIREFLEPPAPHDGPPPRW